VTGAPDLNELAAELRELSRAFGAADATLRESVEGADATGSFTVVLDAAGRVSEVRPASRWRDRLASDAVGDAVIEAAQAAAINRLDVWSQTLDSQPVGEGGTAVDTSVDLTALRADAPYIDLIGMLDEVTATLDQAVAAATPSAPSSPPDVAIAPAVASTAGHQADLSYGSRPVVVALDATGAVHSVDIELGWLRRTDRGRLGETLTAAFARAYDLLDADAEPADDVADPGVRAGSGLPPMSAQLTEIIRNPAAALAAFASQL
jgi:DNA-binding protein YbaB